jgi:hypothetical protein
LALTNKNADEIVCEETEILEKNLSYSPDGWHVISGLFDRLFEPGDVETGAAVGEPPEGYQDGVVHCLLS